MANTLYFSHDYNARNDIEMVKLKYHLGHEGKSVFWDLVEMLFENDGYLFLNDIPVFAKLLDTSIDLINNLINNFDLFKKDDTKFWSETALKRLKFRVEKSEKARESVNKRWEKPTQNELEYDCNTNVIPTYNERNTIKDKDKDKRKRNIEEGEKNSVAIANPPIFKFKTNKYEKTKELYSLTKKFYDECSELYPSVNLDEHFTKMQQWLDEKPEKRKTLSGMEIFITKWLEREQNKGVQNETTKSSDSRNGFSKTKSVITTDDIQTSRRILIEQMQVSDGVING